MKTPIPHKDILEATFLTPHNYPLSEDKRFLISLPQGATHTREPQPKRAHQFESVRHVRMPHNDVQNVNQGDYSLFGWIYMGDASSFGIGQKGRLVGSDIDFLFAVTSGDNLFFGMTEDGSAWNTDRISTRSTNTLTSLENQWIWVYADYDGSSTSGSGMTLDAYDATFNSIALGSYIVNDVGTFTQGNLGVRQVDIGRYFDINDSNGRIFDFRIVNHTLTQEDKFNAMRGKRLGGEVLWAIGDSEIPFDASGAMAHGEIVGTTPENIVYEGADVPGSYQNSCGFTVASGGLYYLDMLSADAIPDGTLIPQIKSRPNKCAAYIAGVEADLVLKGSARKRAKIINVPCGNFITADDYHMVVSHDVSQHINRSAFSILAVVNMRDCTNFRILSKGITTAGEIDYLLTLTGGDDLFFAITNEGSAFTGDRIAVLSTNALTSFENEWIIVYGGYDGVGTSASALTIKAFQIDGTPIDLGANVASDVGTFTQAAQSTEDIFIGRYPSGGSSNYADGMMANLRLIAKELNDTEIVESVTKALLFNEERMHIPFVSQSGATEYDISDNGNDAVWQNFTNANQYGVSNESVDFRLLNGFETYTHDLATLPNIYVPFKNDGTRITPTITGYTKQGEYKGILEEKHFPDIGIQIDFSALKCLPANLPNNWTPGDVIPGNMILDDNIENKKIMIAKEVISDNDRLTEYTRSLAVSGGTSFPYTLPFILS